jgi:hypothetical protein
MPDHLLAAAWRQADRSKPPVRAAALMRIARVQTALDRSQARSTFEQGLDETRRLSGSDGEFLLEQAQLLAAAVAPDLLREIPSPGHIPRHFLSERLGSIMLEHEHGDAAFEYAIRYDEASTFPFSVVSALMQWFGDEERRMALLRRAIDAWRAAPNDRFIHLFQSQWKAAPPDEAATVAREIFRVTLQRPDQPITASYDTEGTVRITSGREHTLFQILHILRRLDGPLAESLIAGHRQLAAAARRFPNGMDSVIEEARIPQSNASGASCGGGYAIGGSSRDMPFLKALVQASQDGDFGPPIEHALARYRDDAAPDRPNQFLQEFWPSTCHFRSILYRAGGRLGTEAAIYLDRIPDADLRLFAQIELAAALAGLPELQGRSGAALVRTPAPVVNTPRPLQRWRPETQSKGYPDAAQMDPAYAAPNATGPRAPRTAGFVSADMSGTRSTPAESVRDAVINGKSLRASGAANGPHTPHGTCRNETHIGRPLRVNPPRPPRSRNGNDPAIPLTTEKGYVPKKEKRWLPPKL